MASKQGSAGIFLRAAKLFVETASVFNAYKADKNLWGGAIIAEPSQFGCLMSIQAPDAEIGSTVRKALLATRISKGRYPGQPPPGGMLSTHESDEALAQSFGLSSARRLSQGLKFCQAGWRYGRVHLTPSLRGRGISFGDYPRAWRDQHPEIVVPFEVSDDYLGSAVRRCLSHCA